VSEPLRIAVLLSGSGTSLENLFACIERGELDARIEVVVASRADAGGLERARRRGVPAHAVPRKQHPDVTAFNDRIHELLAGYEIDVVALLGFLSPFEPRERFRSCTLNVHPALIPKYSGRGFYGRRVHEAVIAAGERESGATVHFVDDEYDHGPILLQDRVPVRPDDTPDTLAERVQALERRLVPEALRRFHADEPAVQSLRRRLAGSRSAASEPERPAAAD
jgi:phosphoribosylglycinamide formyltransferase-1